MQVTFYGTRGSIAVSARDKVEYGGNTTCLRIDSPCLPAGHWLIVDAGTGLMPLSDDFMAAGGKEATILYTHYHIDHTEGFKMTPFAHVKSIPVRMIGPYEHGKGSRRVYQEMMVSPHFPVGYGKISSHIRHWDIEFPDETLLVIHPVGGIKRIELDPYERILRGSRQIPFDKGRKFDVGECLVVRMHRNHHPEYANSYRFEEGPTGRTFVFVTDHENQDGIADTFRAHLANANLLVMDCQYTRERYERSTTGYGHSTPDYVSFVARAVAAERLGITHHDPKATDDDVDRIVAMVDERMKLTGNGVPVFGCRDYMTLAI